MAQEQKIQRNVAVDAYRGFVMLLMMAEVIQFAHVALSFPNSLFWRILAFNQSHVEWVGMSLHDTIQPSFTFLVGVALPYSLRSRQKKGTSFARMLGHAIWRSFLLIALGIFFRSTHSPITYFTFEDTLTQIGLGYTFVFLLMFAHPRWQWIGFGSDPFRLLAGMGSLSGAGPRLQLRGGRCAGQLASTPVTGFAAHWNMNSNFGHAFDVWFLNLFPRTSRFLYNDGGYLTLSFIPTLATMLLGLCRGTLVAGGIAGDSDAEVPGGRRRFHGCWPIVPLHRGLPHCEARLDAFMDAVQRRRVLLLSGCLFVGHRNQETAWPCIPACRDRHELHRRVSDCSPL